MKLLTAFIFSLSVLFNPLAHAVNCADANNNLSTKKHDGEISGYCNVTIEKKGKVQNGGITADGDVVLEKESYVDKDINAGGSVDIGEKATVQNGYITADGDVVLENESYVDKDINAGGSVDIGEKATVQNGYIIAAGEVVLQKGSKVEKGITAGGDITIGAGTVQNEDVTSGGDIILESGSFVNANIIAAGNVIIEDSTVQNGNINAGGDITLEYGADMPDGNVVAEGVLYLKGKIFKQNGTVCGKLGVSWADVSNDGSLTGDQIFVGENCNETWDGIPPAPDFSEVIDQLENQCAAIFPSAFQSHSSSGEFKMNKGVATIVTDNPELAFAGKFNVHKDSCGSGVSCTQSGDSSQALTLVTISEENGSSIDIDVDDGETFTLGDKNNTDAKYSGVRYKKIEVEPGGTLIFASRIGEVFEIDRLLVKGEAKVIFSPGQYAIYDADFEEGDSKGKDNDKYSPEVSTLGDGHVYIFTEIDFNFQGAIDADSANFTIVASNKATIKVDDGKDLHASVYADNNLIITGDNSSLYGAYSGGDYVEFKPDGNNEVVMHHENICGVPLTDYFFNIEASAQALTCESEPVTLQVLNEDGSLNENYSGVVDLSVITLPDDNSAGVEIGDWSIIPDSSQLDNKGNGIATYEFDGTEGGEITLMLSVIEATNISVSMSQGTIVAEKEIEFQSSMIKVEQTCTNPISTQCINIANRRFDLTLTAIKENEDTAVCESYSPENIAFWSEYVSPNSVALAVDVENAPIGDTELLATSIPVEFSDGVATVTANYPDAGKIKIHLKDADVDDITGEIETIVNPYKLVIDDLTAHKRDTDTNRVKSTSGFIRASEPDYDDLKVDTFDVTVKAIIDCTSTGEAKNCSAVNAYETAASFNNTVTLLASKVDDYELGTLDYENSLKVSLTEGTFSYQNLAYSEVGSLGLQLESKDYLLADNTVSVDDIKEIGRFYPDYLAWGMYDFTAACNGFSYLGQQASELSYSLTAYNQASSPSETSNYDKTRGYPVAPTDSFEHYAFAGTTDLTSRLLADDYYNEDNWLLGIYTVSPQVVGVDRITNTPDGPYLLNDITSASEYWVELIGIDGEKIDASTGCSGDRCLLGNLGDLVYGRLQAGNGHGSEFQSIRTLIEATYFDGSTFMPMSRDICSTINMAQVSSDPVKSSADEIIIGSGKTALDILSNTLINGFSYFEFSAPGDRGKLDYFIDLKSNVDENHDSPWLLDEGNAVECPDALITPPETVKPKDCISGYVEFGLFRGNDRIIYRNQTFD